MVYSVRDAIHWGLFEIIGEQMSEHDLRKDENASAHEQNDEVTRDNALFVVPNPCQHTPSPYPPHPQRALNTPLATCHRLALPTPSPREEPFLAHNRANRAKNLTHRAECD